MKAFDPKPFERLGIPMRKCEAAPGGEVPRWIVRIEYEAWGWAITRSGRRVRRWRNHKGWQVRYQIHEGRKTKYFVDSRSKVASLVRACEYLLSIYEGPADRHAKREKTNKAIKTGYPGVRFVFSPPKNGRTVGHWSAEMSILPGIKNTPKRFYIGTERTATQERAQAAVQRANDLRMKLLEGRWASWTEGD